MTRGRAEGQSGAGVAVVLALFAGLWLGLAAAVSAVLGIARADAAPAVVLAPFALAGLASLRWPRRAVPMLLPGLLVFFKVNDALAETVGGTVTNDTLAAALALWLLFRLGRDQLIETVLAGRLFLILLAGLAGVLLVSSINAVDRAQSFATSAIFGKDVALAILLALSIRTRRDLDALIDWLILSTAFCAVIILYDTMQGAPLFPGDKIATWQGALRSSGASTESVPDVAALILMGTILAGTNAARKARGRWLYIGAAILGVAAVLATISRAPFAALLVMAGLFLYRHRHEAYFAKAVSLSLATLLVAVLTLAQPVISKFGAVAAPSEDRTVARRLSYQEIGIDLFGQAPFLGIGAGNYAVHFASDEYRFVGGRGSEARPLHNIYLQYATETGLLGFGYFIGLVGAIAATLLRGTRSGEETIAGQSEGLLLAHISICALLLALSSKSFLGLWLLVGFSIALARLMRKHGPPGGALQP